MKRMLARIAIALSLSVAPLFAQLPGMSRPAPSPMEEIPAAPRSTGANRSLAEVSPAARLFRDLELSLREALNRASATTSHWWRRVKTFTPQGAAVAGAEPVDPYLNVRPSDNGGTDQSARVRFSAAAGNAGHCGTVHGLRRAGVCASTLGLQSWRNFRAGNEAVRAWNCRSATRGIRWYRSSSSFISDHHPHRAHRRRPRPVDYGQHLYQSGAGPEEWPGRLRRSTY